MTWVQTRGGRAVDLDAPRADQIDLSDIAHHLSGIQRYTGASSGWSVAQHSLLVLRLVEQHPHPATIQVRRAALLHDAAEAYVGDASAPLKRLLQRMSGDEPSILDVVEGAVQDAVGERFHVRCFDHWLVKDADRWALAVERRTFFPETPRSWGEIDEAGSPMKDRTDLVEDDHHVRYGVSRSDQAHAFLDAACRLGLDP